MKDIKKLMITLVALLALTTGAWAKTDPNAVYWTNKTWAGWAENVTTHTVGDITITCSGNAKAYEALVSGEPLALQAGANDAITFTSNGKPFTSIKIQVDTNSDPGIAGWTWVGSWTIEWSGTPSTSVTLSGCDIVADIITFTFPPASSGPEVDWNKTTKTGTFTMPGGNVELEPEYYPQAALTAAPTAINDVPATTDGAIVKAGTVANIGSTTNAQGTVMYYVSPTALDDAALLALAADAWTADVPTAQSLAQGQYHVYYYVRGNDSDTDDEIFSDGDILSANALTVNIAAAPTYAVTFADDLAEPDKWTASPAANVKKGETVTVTYSGSKKVLGVKAEKKAPVTYPMVSEATASDYGKVVCAAGHLHDAKTAVPTGCTAVAIFAYIDGGNNRIAIALQDGEAATWYTLTTDGANNNTLCSVPGTWTVTAPTDAEWFVGTKAIYEAIFTNLGSTTGDSDGKTYDDNVNAYITTVGGKALSGGYWSTSEKSESIGWDFGSGCWYNDYKTTGLKVRPVLAW